MFTTPLIITKQGEEMPYEEGLIPVLRHLALEGEAKTPIYMIMQDEEEEEIKTLIATLSGACPQHSCEIPIMGDAKFICEGDCKVHAIFTVDMEEPMDDFDEEDMEGMEGMDEEDFEDMEDDGEFEEMPIETKKIEDVKKPVAPKQEEKKVEMKKEVPKKEAKKEEPKKEQPKKEENNKKKNKKNKNKNKK